MDDRDDAFVRARERIARQRGRLTGWRPMHVGEDVAVVAVEVLGHVRDEPTALGLRVAVAGRDPAALERDSERAAAVALRKRAVLGPDDPFIVQQRGPLHTPHEDTVIDDDPLTWPWRTLTFHVPLERLPAIAGLATDAVRGD